MNQREKKLQQGRDRVTEIYKDTHWIDELVYMNRQLLQGLPPWGDVRHTRFADSKEVTKDGRLRCNEQHSKTWCFKLGRTYKDLMNHVTVEYLPLPIEVATLVESSLLSRHYTEHGNLPLLNSSF